MAVDARVSPIMPKNSLLDFDFLNDFLLAATFSPATLSPFVKTVLGSNNNDDNWFNAVAPRLVKLLFPSAIGANVVVPIKYTWVLPLYFLLFPQVSCHG